MESVNTITLLNGSVLECFPKAEQPPQILPDQMSFDTTGTYMTIGKPKYRNAKQKQRDEERRKKAKEEEQRRNAPFVQNAFMFYRNADKILSDSRLFLTPVPVQNEMAYTGTSGFRNPTLGGYVEWWLNCEAPITKDLEGNDALTWFFAGSPLTGANECRCVYPDGTIQEIHHKYFHTMFRAFKAINDRYTEAKQRYESYSLEEAIAMLKKEQLYHL